MQKHDSKYFARIPPPTLGMGSKGQTSFFSEYGHVAYYIKGNDECSNIQARILSLHTPSTPGVGSNVKTFFLKVVMLHIKLKGMEHKAHMLCTHTPSTPRWGQNVIFLKVVMLHIKSKEWNIEHHASTYSVLTYTLDPWGGIKGQHILF